jgi:ABC-2 type transport system ATP-binding protein
MNTDSIFDMSAFFLVPWCLGGELRHPMTAIEVNNFVKRYGAELAVKGISLSVAEGELFGLIGPDGAGKTSLMRGICTLLTPDEGSIRVLGMDVQRQVPGIRAIIGYMPQRFSLYQDLSVEQNLRFFADLFQVPTSERPARLERLYRFSRLHPFRKRKAGALSGGMKQKLALSCALIHTPKVLVLDEPTMGVDPVSRTEFWNVLHAIQQQGTTILVSTAYMEEAGQCNRVALMHQGRILILGTPPELRASFRHPLYRVTGADVRGLRAFLQQLPVVHSTQLFGDAVHVSFAAAPTDSDWPRWQQQSGGNLQRWQVQSPSIEDVFMEATQEQRETPSPKTQ